MTIALPLRPIATGFPPPVRRNRLNRPLVGTVALAVGANVVVGAGLDLRFLGPAICFWLILIYPTYLLYTSSLWRSSPVGERLGYSLTGVLLLLLLGGLALNTGLPAIGDSRPLDPIPILLLADVLNLGLYVVRQRYPTAIDWRAEFGSISRAETRLIVGSGLCVALVVLGANRLNNGAGDTVSLAGLAGVVLALAFLLRGQSYVREGVTTIVVYLVSLSLLLMTSLRGWYVTGHDVQREYRTFQLTDAHGRWDFSSFHSAYNACLSITILPTELAQVLNVDHPYVYKAFFQLMFALCPVLVYTLARRYWSSTIAILAAIYFVGFPTFFTDMPFLNRQEIGFLFLCAGFLAVTNQKWQPRRRRLGLVVASVGVELSHYSTMYILAGTLGLAWAIRHVSTLRRHRHQITAASTDRATSYTSGVQTIGIGSLVAVALVILVWGGLVTATVGPALREAGSSVSGLVTHSAKTRSSDTSGSLLGGTAQSPQTLLNKYAQSAQALRSQAGPGTFPPASVVAGYPTPAVPQASLPLTGAGKFLSNVGVPVAGLNSTVRQAAAKGEQLFAGIGLLSFIVVRRLRRQIGREFLLLATASLLIVVVVTLLPNLSVDYNVLRAFQEALILIAPILVVGSLTVFRALGKIWSQRAAVIVCLGIFVSTSGLMPQLLGGYPAQLSLNNSGIYYDLYYTHPQEVAAIGWLAGKPGVLPAGVQADDVSDRFTFTGLSDVTGEQVISDIYPAFVRRTSWVVLSYATVHTGRATTFYDGDLLTYTYPVGYLQQTKNLVYNDGGAEIYR